MRAVLDEHEAELLAGGAHAIYVRQVTPHVGQHQITRAGAFGLSLEIVEVDDVAIVDVHQHRSARRRAR